MEKSWGMKNWPKVMEFCNQSWNFTKFVPKLYQICTLKKLSIDVESSHFLMFSAKCHKYKIKKRDGHGKSRNGHGKVMEKYFVKFVGTLPCMAPVPLSPAPPAVRVVRPCMRASSPTCPVPVRPLGYHGNRCRGDRHDSSASRQTFADPTDCPLVTVAGSVRPTQKGACFCKHVV